MAGIACQARAAAAGLAALEVLHLAMDGVPVERVLPARDPSVVTEQDRESWLARTDPAAMDVLRFWFEEWDEDRVQGGKGRYNDKWFPHGPLGAAGSAEIDREIRRAVSNLFE